MFSCEFCEIFRNIFFHRTPLAAASEKIKAEAVVRKCSVKKMVLQMLLNWQENTCARVFFTALGLPATLLKQGLRDRCFRVNFANTFLRTRFFYRTPPVAASVKAKVRLRHHGFLCELSKNFPMFFWCAARIF